MMWGVRGDEFGVGGKRGSGGGLAGRCEKLREEANPDTVESNTDPFHNCKVDDGGDDG